MQIRLAIHEILADKDFTATNILISQLFVVAFVHPTYVQGKVLKREIKDFLYPAMI